MRITIDEESGDIDLTLYDTEADGIISIRWDDEHYGLTVSTTDIHERETISLFDKNEFKSYLKLVLDYLEKE